MEQSDAASGAGEGRLEAAKAGNLGVGQRAAEAVAVGQNVQGSSR